MRSEYVGLLGAARAARTATRVFRRGAAALGVALAILAGAGWSAAGLDDLGGTKPGELPSGGKFLDADGCAQCHGGGVAGDTSYLPSDTWAGTMMANAARDPVFFAALAVANQDAPGVGTYCIRCHAPIGFVRGHATPSDGSALDKVDKQGIGCEVCHRAEQSLAPNDPYYLGDAQLVFSDDATKHGPYGSAPSPVHSSEKDLGLSDSRFCGQCHQVSNPGSELRDAAGAPMGIAFPLDTTFEEWAASAYSDEGSAAFAGCVDCHMPRVSGDKPVATPAGSPLRKDPRRHALSGGNYWGIQAVMQANPDRAAAFPVAFENALENTLETLKTAVKVTIEDPPSSLVAGEPFEVKVRVANLSGHKFPAGYAESRRAWLSVALVDPHDHEAEPIFLAGGYDEATGHIVEEPKTR
ncbi:MAG TPA: multiheme c-type cytochrome, partial [Polyangiaceae bacterium]|nr:multiheme c-type cytochrome [Polyangiaceae bacterium]